MCLRKNKGFHPTLEEGLPYIFVDSCMQIWPDAEFSVAHRHGVTTYAVTSFRPHSTLEAALEGLMYWYLVTRQHHNILVVNEIEDIHCAQREEKVGLLLAAQDGGFVDNKLHRIEAFYRLGLRMMIPAYNATNLICGGALDRNDCGLSKFGVLVVAECNRVGLLLDCTHVGRRASLEIIEHSSQPVVFSHANAKSVIDNPRNIDDEQIKKCAGRGGVIGIAPWGPLVLKEGRTEWPTIDDLIEHIDYVAQLLGSTDNIGIGTDMSLGTYPDHEVDPWGAPDYFREVVERYNKHITADVRSPMRAVDGFSNYAEVTNLIDKLLQLGYSDEDVAQILGENFVRVFGQVWR